MSAVFFLFLVHLALGLLAMLPFVSARAGARFFKFCSASAAFMMTAAIWVQWRRGSFNRPMLLAVVVSLAATILYNRAQHFGWRKASPALLCAALASGLASVLLATPAEPRWLVAAADLTSILLLGAAASAMILGHWYLVVIDLPIAPLRRLTVLLVLGLVLRAAVIAWALAGPGAEGWRDARMVAAGLWSPDGVFVWMRVLFGVAGPLSLIWFVWKTVEIRSTQSATGILYVQLFLVMAGELLAKYLRVAAGLAL